MSEACLTINVIRGSSVDENSKLPVGVWIHGGGFYMGSGSDERYNMSAIVANSYELVGHTSRHQKALYHHAH